MHKPFCQPFLLSSIQILCQLYNAKKPNVIADYVLQNPKICQPTMILWKSIITLPPHTKETILRYLLLTYYTKPDGKIDEAMAVSKRVKPSDLQTASVILDFKKLEVVKASMGGVAVPRDWDRIVSYYHQHYANTIERLLKENGYEIVKDGVPADSDAAKNTAWQNRAGMNLVQCLGPSISNTDAVV